MKIPHHYLQHLDFKMTIPHQYLLYLDFLMKIPHRYLRYLDFKMKIPHKYLRYLDFLMKIPHHYLQHLDFKMLIPHHYFSPSFTCANKIFHKKWFPFGRFLRVIVGSTFSMEEQWANTKWNLTRNWISPTILTLSFIIAALSCSTILNNLLLLDNEKCRGPSYTFSLPKL